MPHPTDYGALGARLRDRTRLFAILVIGLCRRFPRRMDGYVVARQLIRSATSTAANYRAACRSRTPAEFTHKIGIVCEEADECEFWLDITVASEVIPATDLEARKLLAEASELVRIFAASQRTAKQRAAKRSR